MGENEREDMFMDLDRHETCVEPNIWWFWDWICSFELDFKFEKKVKLLAPQDVGSRLFFKYRLRLLLQWVDSEAKELKLGWEWHQRPLIGLVAVFLSEWISWDSIGSYFFFVEVASLQRWMCKISEVISLAWFVFVTFWTQKLQICEKKNIKWPYKIEFLLTVTF